MKHKAVWAWLVFLFAGGTVDREWLPGNGQATKNQLPETGDGFSA
jgi:hypothetical protein